MRRQVPCRNQKNLEIEFKQYKPTETAPSDAELLELEVVLREKIKLYEQLIQDAQSTD